MDRNFDIRDPATTLPVALRKESVDRNLILLLFGLKKWESLSARRAWIEMLVKLRTWKMRLSSLSARRAWIEIAVQLGCKSFLNSVALRKESVDRNIVLPLPILLPVSSLSARRAWIEIIQKIAHLCLKPVALRKESVDRNIGPLIFSVQPRSRSPQGERG